MAHRYKKHQDEEISYWLSYSDMMAGLLLMFVLIISFTIMMAQKQYEKAKEDLAEQQTELAEEQEKVAEQETALKTKSKKIEDQQKQLEDQKGQLEDQQKQLGDQQKQLDQLVGVRTELIEALKDEFDGTDLKVSVDPQTGAIMFDSNVLFDYGKNELKDSGKTFLKEFIPRYFGILMSKDFKKYVAEIIIEGHTDTKGQYLYNLELSQQRALSVAKYCLDDDSAVLSKGKTKELRNILTANGRSFSDPIYNADGTVNMDASRRVEFKFRLKDDEMISEMTNILNQE